MPAKLRARSVRALRPEATYIRRRIVTSIWTRLSNGQAMNAIEVLSQEHRMISVALDILETLASRLNAGEPVPNAILADAVVFLREFADEGHHAREEQLLFPMLVARASRVETNAINECIAQHEAARKLRQDLECALESLERGEAGAAGAFVISARQYVQLLRDHMQLEDRYSRRLAKRVLSTAENGQLVEHMRAMDRNPHASSLQRFDRLVEDSCHRCSPSRGSKADQQ